MKIDYNIQVWQEGNQFVAHATPLDVMSSGPTPADAAKALDEAVRLFLVTAKDIGTLEDLLQEAGYQLQQDHWVSPNRVAIESHSAAVTV